MNTTKIKICGLFRPCDAEYINEVLSDYAGFVFYEKSHRFVTEDLAKELRTRISPSITTVGVFVGGDLRYIKKLFEGGVISIIQLHGEENEAYITALRALLPSAEIWKAFTVRSADDVLRAKKCTADRILLDNGYGTGKCFDWSFIEDFDSRMILAGGLTPDNIRLAIEQFHPFAVDISSGVETNKVKDREKILSAAAAVRGG